MDPIIKLSNKCERCPRVVDRTVTYAELDAMRAKTGGSPPTAMKLYVAGELVVSYDFLCSTCTDIVKNYLGAAAKLSEKMTAHRAAKPKASPVAPVAPAKPPVVAPPVPAKK